MRWRGLAAPVVAALVAVIVGAPAQASLAMCNRTSYVLYAATGAQSGTNVAVKGWTRLAPGECKPVIPGDLVASAYFIHARTSLAHSGPPRAWGGPASFCAREGTFALTTTPTTNCDGDSFPLGFAGVDTHHMRNWTMTLTESPAIKTLIDAQLAGLKRLLRDNHLKVGAIDGQPDKDAAASLATFRSQVRMPPKASAADLFDALETDAMKMTAPAGYTICNDGKSPLGAAIAQKGSADFVSHGWWTIAAGTCAKAITTALATDKIFLYAQLPTGKPVVTGSNEFCIANVAFDIQGRARCKERGLQIAGFAETATRGQSGHVAHIDDDGLLAPYAFHPGTAK
jgi:uncharacterized membrane protein